MRKHFGFVVLLLCGRLSGSVAIRAGNYDDEGDMPDVSDVSGVVDESQVWGEGSAGGEEWKLGDNFRGAILPDEPQAGDAPDSGALNPNTNHEPTNNKPRGGETL
eukprot:Selendium_serpulae@DN2593_c0_g1_i2.p1